MTFKKTIFSLTVVILSAAFFKLQVFSEQLKEPKYISGRPQYAKFILINNEELLMVFDESGGTGTGYDTLYADVNFNKDLTEDADKINVDCFEGGDIRAKITIQSNNFLYTLNCGSYINYYKRRAYRISAIASININKADWVYSNSADLKLTVFNKLIPAKIFNKDIIITFDASIITKNGQELLDVRVKWLDEKGNKVVPLTTTKNKMKVYPSMIIANEEGNPVLNAPLVGG